MNMIQTWYDFESYPKGVNLKPNFNHARFLIIFSYPPNIGHNSLI
jgi:hypothetical protein